MLVCVCACALHVPLPLCLGLQVPKGRFLCVAGPNAGLLVQAVDNSREWSNNGTKGKQSSRDMRAHPYSSRRSFWLMWEVWVARKSAACWNVSSTSPLSSSKACKASMCLLNGRKIYVLLFKLPNG